MREFYVGSSDENIKVADGNATMVFWKDCITRHVDCLAVQYFLTQPVNISVDEHKTNKWIFNFPTHISIDRIRDCVHKGQDICLHCGMCRQRYM